MLRGKGGRRRNGCNLHLNFVVAAVDVCYCGNAALSFHFGPRLQTYSNRTRYYCLTERVQISSTSSKLSSIYIVEIEAVIDIGMRKGRK